MRRATAGAQPSSGVTARRAVRTTMVFFRVEAQQTVVGRSRAKSFGADLGGNKKAITWSSKQWSRLQTKSSLRLDS